VSTDADETQHEDGGSPVNISLSLGEEGDLWIARDEDTGVTSQGPTRQSAPENLDEAVAGYHGAGDAPSEEDLRELGIDPSRNQPESVDDSNIFE
jgi:predicted RNase H-like HicB family nuclease